MRLTKHARGLAMFLEAESGTMNLRSGTVTFLFTDVEGSTRLWEQHPEQMQVVLARHDVLAATLVERYDGKIIKRRGEGDSLFVVFASHTDAVAAACALQRAYFLEDWPDGISLRVRLALHIGEAQLRDDDYYGAAVNRCARLRAIAHGGQTLLSHALYQLTKDSLPEGAALLDMGLHRLKDLQTPEHVWQLCVPGTHAEFPPLRSLNFLQHNLPQQVTSFVGREREMAAIKQLLGNSRLLTLTGAGGSGKTRLSLQVAVDFLETESDGVWLVELAPITDPDLVPQTVAQVLGVREAAERPLVGTLCNVLRQKKLLLILDTCEHVLPACSQLADTLLRNCPELKILATSREPLGIAGENVYRVPSLSLPDLQQELSPESLNECEAVRLFVERAQAGAPNFTITAQNAAALAQLCHRLDGIPLAIELASARIRVLSVEQIAARLHDRFRLLTGGSRTALPRQQTLRALIDWSYDLLNETEQALFRSLSVFLGGWTLEMAEQICMDQDRPDQDVLEVMSGLVNKSLVLYEEHAEEGRYRLLETVRQYARDRLLESGESAIWRSRHRDWCVRFAEQAFPMLKGPNQQVWLERLDAEHDNMRAALDWCNDAEDGVEPGLRLGGALWPYWDIRGYFREGLVLLSRVLNQPGAEVRTRWRANALNGAGNLAKMQGNYAQAEALHTESLAIRRELGESRGVAGSLHNLATVAKQRGDLDKAEHYYEQALALNQESGNLSWQAYTLGSLGNVAKDKRDYALARKRQMQSLELARQLGDKRLVAYSLHNLGTVAYYQGDYEEAQRLQAEGLRWLLALGDRPVIAISLLAFAFLAVAQGNPQRAAVLFGAEAAQRAAMDASIPPAEQAEHAQNLAQARDALGEEAFCAGWEQGRLLSLEQAVAFALENA